MAKANTTQIRILKTINERLDAARKAAQNGMSIVEFVETVLQQALEQIEREKPAPGPLAIVELLRRQRGLGSADALRTMVANSEELRSVVREEMQVLLDTFSRPPATVSYSAKKKKRKAASLRP